VSALRRTAGDDALASLSRAEPCGPLALALRAGGVVVPQAAGAPRADRWSSLSKSQRPGVHGAASVATLPRWTIGPWGVDARHAAAELLLAVARPWSPWADDGPFGFSTTGGAKDRAAGTGCHGRLVAERAKPKLGPLKAGCEAVPGTAAASLGSPLTAGELSRLR